MKKTMLYQMWMMILCTCLLPYSARSQQLVLTEYDLPGVSQPMQITHAGDGSNRLFVAQRSGTIKAFLDNNFLGNFLSVTGISTQGEGGLLSLVFHPEYAENGLLYVFFTNTGGDLQVDRYQVSDDPNIVDVDSRVNVIIIPHPTNSNHNGGELHFGPDGMLYLSTGDGGGGGDPNNNSQNTTSLLGKLLRLAVSTGDTPPYYSVPVDNPFGNEVFAYGLRNPFRWSFDPLNGDVWIGDVGQGNWEEINHVPFAELNRTNFGWRCYEGNDEYNVNLCNLNDDFTFPVFVYANITSAAVTGGVVYRGTQFPSLIGSYITADYVTGDFYKITFTPENGYIEEPYFGLMTGISDFGVGEDQTLYATRLTSGQIFKVETDEPVPVIVLSFTGHQTDNEIQLNWHITKAVDIHTYVIERSNDGIHYTRIGEVTQNSSEVYQYTDLRPHPGVNYYRLRIIETNGLYYYSDIVKVASTYRPVVTIYPTSFSCASPITAYSEQDGIIEVFDIHGARVNLTNLHAGQHQILTFHTCQPGMYLVRFKSGNVNYHQKIISTE